MTPATLSRARLLPMTLLALVAALATAHSASASGEPMWTTYHHDAGRSGVDPEKGLAQTPQLDWQSPKFQGETWGQPLVLGERVYVATAGDFIYALDAASGEVVWSKQAGTPVPDGKLPCSGDIAPAVGMVGTPVIDTAAGAIYVVADTWDQATQKARHVLGGYRLSDGVQLLSTPVDPPGADATALLQRTALTLDEGKVVFGMGGNDGDCGEYLGTVVAVPEGGGKPRFWQYHPKSPAFSGGAVWGPSGPVVVGGDIYVADGNPNTSAGQQVSGYDFSDSLLRLDPATDLVPEPANEPATPLGWFEPPTWSFDSNNDLDLGSAGPELLPGGVLFQAGKNGRGYLLETGVTGASTALYEHPVCSGAESFGGDAFAGGVIYVACQTGVQALSYDQSARTFALLWQGPSDASGPPIIAAGTVWVVKGGGAKLYGLDPATGQTRYTETLPSGVSDHFASPSAAGGRLFVATGASVSAYRIAQPESSEAVPSAPVTAAPPKAAGASAVGAKGPASASPAAIAAPANAWLERWRLRVGTRGGLSLQLRCPATATCAGTITLWAKIAPIGGANGKHGRRRIVSVRLAHIRYGPNRGRFEILTRLHRGALAHLRLHHGRLTLLVRIATPGGVTRLTTALLTQSPLT
ncbi:MAG TPA: PQQ-binding-like beta-propeller repeat protein [Solirubrobacteraceae bacterium]|jgi:outer membrane protein assembly factor BamB|nr:PQQ-binding-like beta-propeller repeat protein [Solirubrobacteraceae bacterium]